MTVMFIILNLLLPSLEIIPQGLTLIDQNTEVMTLNKDDYSLVHTDFLIIDTMKLNGLLDEINALVSIPSIDATLDKYGNIVEEKPGIMLNRDKFVEMFYSFFYEGSFDKINIPLETTFSRVNSELLGEISINKIGEYTTFFKESNQERTHNIMLSAVAINNHVVFPGEKFSFNEVVGERTKEKGYKKAPVIVKGELSEDIGGGICQVSSTLFNAVSLRGIQIVERYSHSRSVPYVPPGKDATVSWWGPDFVFVNQYDSPILIRAFTEQGKMTIVIYSSEGVHVD